MPGRTSKASYSSKSPVHVSKSPVHVSKSPVYASKSPVHASKSPTPSVVQQVERPGFFSNMIQGFALGTGQSIAMNIFRSDPKVTHVHENAPNTNTSTVTTGSVTTGSESFYSTEFTHCMNEKWDDKETCKQYVQCLKDNKDDKSLCNLR